MTEEPSTTDCPKCGAPIPAEAPGGLCPKCVLGGAAAPTRGSAPTVVSGGRRVAPPSPGEIAEHFPELEILELIGAGGMGAVYRARQPQLDRLVALKILTQDLAEDPSFVERFNREARVLARLNHPHIVTVFDFGTAGPFCYLLMEHVDGVNLRQAMQAGGFTAADTLALIEDVCEALKFAHEEGVLHRDIKPENILIDSRGRVKIADFGIAKLVGEPGLGDVTLTMHGAVLGSPQYMAPEQIETPGDVDQRADIYSLGVVFYELLTGELPLGRFAPPSERAPMDARIDEIVMRTLEKEREARFQSAGEVETRIEAISQARGGAAGGGGQPSAAAGAGAPGPDQEPAKFALASAILTGSALLVAAVGFFVLPLLAAKGRNEVDALESVYMGAAVLTLLVGIPALLGMVFGFRALGDIRRSGGRKPGLGSAMFGALTVPSLAVVAATGGLFMTLLYATQTAVASPFLLVAIVAIAGPLVAFSLIRRVARWARGEAPEAKPAMPAWRRALNVALAIALAVFAFVKFSPWPKGERPERETEFKQAQLSLPANPYRELWDAYWPEDSPEFVGELKVPPGHDAQLQLRLEDGGGTVSTSQLWKVGAPRDGEGEWVVSLGAGKLAQTTQERDVAGLSCTIWNKDGSEPKSYAKFFQGVLALDIWETKIDLGEENPAEFELGTLSAGASGGRSTLYLRIESAPRGTAAGADAEASTDRTPEADLAAIEMAYTAPAGQITVFALQAPWDQRHETPDDWFVVAPDDTDLEGRITLQLTGELDAGRETRRMVLATLLDAAGETLAEHRLFAPGDHVVSLPPSYPVLEMDAVPEGEITGFSGTQADPQRLDLRRAGLHMVVFGHRQGSEVVDSLRLLAYSVPRPEGAEVGPWIAHQLKRLNEKKGSAPTGDGSQSRIFDIKGDVRARSGFLFDTRERALKGQGVLQRTESLVVSKGAEATIVNAAGAKFRVGPQAEDALIVPQFDNQWLLPAPGSGLTLQVEEWPRGEFTVATMSPAAIAIRKPAAFQLGGDGKLQVLEGEVTVRLNSSGEQRVLESGQAFTMPKPPGLDGADSDTP